VIVIKTDNNTPYYLTDKYEGVRSNNIYIRVQDTNTCIDKSADINHVETLWKKRFGLDVTPYERALIYLQTPDDWSGYSDCERYYKYAPEFQIKLDIMDPPTCDIRDFYHFGQLDEGREAISYDISIFYHQTKLAFLKGDSLDSVGYLTIIPGSHFFKEVDAYNNEISYRYFVQNSIEYIVSQFFYSLHSSSINPKDSRLLHAKNKFLECVLIFDSKEEKVNFNEYAMTRFELLKKIVPNNNLPSFPKISGRNMEIFRKQYSDALIFQKMLDDFRKQNDNRTEEQ